MNAEDEIKSAFLKLLERKPYNEVTILEVCREAGVSNKTFYRHFDNKPAIVREIIRDHWALPIVKARDLLPLDKIKSSTDLMNRRAYQTVFENMEFYRNLLNTYGKEKLGADIASALCEVNRSIYKHYGFDPDEEEFVVRFFSTSQIPVLFWWISERSDIPPERMAEYHYDWSFAHWRERFGDIMSKAQ